MTYEVFSTYTNSGVTTVTVLKSFKSEAAAKRFAAKENAKRMRSGGGFASVRKG